MSKFEEHQARRAKLAPDVKEAILLDSAYIAGMKFGWNCAISEREDLYHAAVERVIKERVDAVEEARRQEPRQP